MLSLVRNFHFKFRPIRTFSSKENYQQLQEIHTDRNFCTQKFMDSHPPPGNVKTTSSHSGNYEPPHEPATPVLPSISETFSSIRLPPSEVPWYRQNLGILPPRSPSGDVVEEPSEQRSIPVTSIENDDQDNASQRSQEDLSEDEDLPPHRRRRKSSRRLTRDQRRDILLMRRLGHKYEDIAKFLGVSQSAVQYTVNTGRASPEHHKAGRKKIVRPDVPRHASGRKIRSDSGSTRIAGPNASHTESSSSKLCSLPDESSFPIEPRRKSPFLERLIHPISASHPQPD